VSGKYQPVFETHKHNLKHVGQWKGFYRPLWSSRIVYCHPCNDFDLQYIDEAERNFNKRKNEH